MNGSDPGKRVGTSLLLKVMAGDKFKAEVSAYYDGGQFNSSEEPASHTSMVDALIGALSGGLTEMGGEAGGTDLINSMLNGSSFTDVYNDLQNSSTDPTKPRAYLNYIMFDEDMNVIAEQSGMLQVTSDCDGGFADLTMPNEITAGRNGYLLTYMSNESNVDVSMDNFLVTYSRGNLMEEQHYYPHGLLVKDGSNTSLANKYLYQGKLLQDEAGMQLYDFHARQYDPQIGRFWGIDPMNLFPSGYTGMGNDPANLTDPTGMQVHGYGGRDWQAKETSRMEQFDYEGAGASVSLGALRYMRLVLEVPGYETTVGGGGASASNSSAQGSNNATSGKDKQIEKIKGGAAAISARGIDVINYQVEGRALLLQLGVRNSTKYKKNSLDWLQVVSTDMMLPYEDGSENTANHMIDTKAGAGGRYPFYLNNEEYKLMSSYPEWNLAFTDRPYREEMVGGIPMAPEKGHWEAELTLVSRDERGRLSPVATIRWGFEIINRQLYKDPPYTHASSNLYATLDK